jgi:hypothetical protein
MMIDPCGMVRAARRVEQTLLEVMSPFVGKLDRHPIVYKTCLLVMCLGSTNMKTELVFK